MSTIAAANNIRLRWAACLLPFEVTALCATAFRIVYRKTSRGLWWDDYFAGLSFILGVLLFSTAWIIPPDTSTFHPTLMVINNWMAILSFLSLIWATRISLTLSIARIMPPQHPVFRFAVILACVFGGICVALIIQVVMSCGRNRSWYHIPPYACAPTTTQGIAILSTDVFGDCLLIAVPLRLFWHIKLKRPAERLLILNGFAASILTSLMSLTCAILLFKPFGSGDKIIVENMMSYVSGTISLIVCNLLVIVTFLYRHYRKSDQEFTRHLADFTRKPATRRQDADDNTNPNNDAVGTCVEGCENHADSRMRSSRSWTRSGARIRTDISSPIVLTELSESMDDIEGGSMDDVKERHEPNELGSAHRSEGKMSTPDREKDPLAASWLTTVSVKPPDQ